MSIGGRIQGTASANLIGAWLLEETSGTDAFDSSANGYDGTYSNVTLNADINPDGGPAPSFNGTNSLVELSSSGAQTAFDPTAGTALIAFKVASSSVWTDTAMRGLFVIRADASNRVYITKDTANNRIDFSYAGGGTASAVTKTGITTTGWVVAAITWDTVADEVKAYWNGTQEGSTQTGLGTWAGAVTIVRPGTQNGSSNFWSGNLGLFALWDVALTPTQIAALTASFTTPDATIRVYIDFDQDGFTAADDVTTDVRNGRASLGILDQVSNTAEVGQLQLTLDNSTRKYSPDNASSAVYGKLVPKTPVQITGIGNSGTFDLWTGFIVAVSVEAQRYGGRLATITCQDRLREYQDLEDVYLPVQTDIAADDLLSLIDAAVFQSGGGSATLTFDDIPDHGDVITIGNKAYMLKDAGEGVPSNDGEVGLFTDRYNTYPASITEKHYYVDDTPENLVLAIHHDYGYPNVFENNTAYAAATPRHTQVVAALDHVSFGNPFRNQNSSALLSSAATNVKLSALATLTGDDIDNVTAVKLYLARVGTNSDTLTLRAETRGGDGFPTGILIDDNATATASESALALAFQYITFTFAAAVRFTDDVCLVLSSSGSPDAANYVVWGADNTADRSNRGDGAVYDGSAWSASSLSHVFWSPGVITVSANARGSWANALDLTATSEHYDATTDTVVAGSGVSTTLSDTYSQNGLYYQVAETATTPGFDVQFTFDITGTGVQLRMYGRYEAAAGHTVQARAYNGSGWDVLGTLAEDTEDALHTYTLSAEHTISGTVTITFYHVSPGNPTHDLYIDHLAVVSDTPDGTADYITVSGATLSGGAQPATFTPSYETGVQNFEYAADTWGEGVNAMTAVQEVADSEYGFFLINRSGNPVFKNTDYWFKAHTISAITLDNTQLDFSARYDLNDIRNQWYIEYRERTLIEGVQIGVGPRVIKLLPGSTYGYDGGRWRPWAEKASNQHAKIVTVSTVNGDTGEAAGAVSVDPPILGTHYTLNTKPRAELGEDITNDTFIELSWAIKGAGVELQIFNTSSRKLFMHDLYLDGDIVDYSSPMEFYVDDSTSIAAYGASPGNHTLWLPTGELFAQSLAEYLLAIWKNPRTIAETVRFNLLDDASATTHLFDIDLFDVLAIDEYQHVFDRKVMVMGIEYSFDAERLTEITYHVRQLDPYEYLILDDATYGELDAYALAL